MATFIHPEVRAELEEMLRTVTGTTWDEVTEETEKEEKKTMAASNIVAPREKRVLTIEGDLAVLQRTVVEREVKTTDFIDELCKSRPLTTEVLPQNCALYTRFNDIHSNAIMSIFVVQLFPHMRKAVWKRQPVTADEERHPERCVKELTVSWPFTQWFVRFKNAGLMDVYLGCTTESLAKNGVATSLSYLPMPNQYDFGAKGFCTGNIAVDMGMSFASKVDAVMEQLLTSMWNDDLQTDFRDTGVINLQDWNDKSVANPEYWKKMRFRQTKWRTVAGLLSFLGLPQ